MMISYAPLFKTMKDKSITTYTLIHVHGLNSRTIHNIKHGKGISTFTLEKLCVALDCTPNDVIEFIKEDNQKIYAFMNAIKIRYSNIESFFTNLYQSIY